MVDYDYFNIWNFKINFKQQQIFSSWNDVNASVIVSK